MKLNGMVIERFEKGVDELLSTIAKRPANSIWTGHDLSSETDDEDFTMTKSYEESVAIMAKGYHEGLDQLTSGTGSLKLNCSAKRNIPRNDIIGFAPHVPNAIAGIPQSMISTDRIKMKSKVLTIVYDSGASGGNAASKLVHAGKNVLNLIAKLESRGYRVSLEVMDCSCKDNDKAFMFVKLKDHRQPINPLKIAYPLIHPSFLRRQMFRWLETNPEVTNKGYRHGYGRTLQDHLGGGAANVRNWMRKHKVISEEVFYTNFYEAYNNDGDKLIELMGLKEKK